MILENNNFDYAINFDYVIAGAGPCGLTIAWILSHYNKKVLIIDRESDIGGCHRVRRVDNLFTEHGPRIYTSAYVNTINLLSDMKLDFNELFTPYNFNFTSIGTNSIFDMKFFEIIAFIKGFVSLFIGSNYSKTVSMIDFMKKNNFTPHTIDYVDRMCRLTDGAGAQKYTLFQFLQLINQNLFYKIYQPKAPNDIGLFKKIKDKLIKSGVKIILDTEIIGLIRQNNKISGAICYDNKYNNKFIIGDIKTNFVIATPLYNLITILNNSDNKIRNSFGNFNDLIKWNNMNSYNVYISVAFHWNSRLELDKVWGFPKGDWGIAFIVLSDYMNFNDPQSKTVISVCTTINNNTSKYTNKTQDQSTKSELINEIFRQLKEAFPHIPYPTKAILSPGIKRLNNKWISLDDAFMLTKNSTFSKFPMHSIFPNLFSVGTHNGNSVYHFTTFESAVCNAINFCHNVIPESKQKYKIEKPYELIPLIKIIILIGLLSVLIYLTFFLKTKNIVSN